VSRREESITALHALNGLAAGWWKDFFAYQFVALARRWVLTTKAWVA
jgi:hypothetical protein